MQQKTIDGLQVQYTADKAYSAMTYLIMPFDISAHADRWCAMQHTNIAVVTGMDWDNDLTPWPAPGQPKGTPYFEGKAPEFLQTLRTKVAPAVEEGLQVETRNLVGVSLSGLFALWAWMQDDYFANIGSISGSFWYEGFVDWLDRLDVPKKTGKAYFTLGEQEPHSKEPVFATVGECTGKVVARLRACGIDARLQWVPGNHYSPIGPRLELVFQNL